MTPLQKNILAACKHRPQTLRELQNALQVDNSRLRNTVTGMVATGMLSARNGTYVPGFAVMENTDAPAGIPCTLVKLAARFGFASRDDGTGDIFIPGRALHGAMPQDKIIIKLFDHPRVEGSAEGEVVEVTTPHNTFAGTIVLTEDGRLAVEPDGCRDVRIVLDKKGVNGAQLGDKVGAILTNRGQRHMDHRCAVAERFGTSDRAAECAKAVLYGRDVRQEFPEEVLAESHAYDNALIDPAEAAPRADLRGLPIFTIDSAETKDIDDAISLMKTQNGGYELGVHIADVSHYVRPDTALDKEAYERATSIYYADKVIPMLPTQLSNGICSLNEGEERLAFSCLMQLDESGNIHSYQFVKSVIRSRVKGVYKEINALLDGSNDPALVTKYKDVMAQLPAMTELYEKRLALRKARGAMEIESDEAKLVMDEEGRCVDIVKRTRGVSECMIEEFMLLANQCAANAGRTHHVPFVYRIHEARCRAHGKAEQHPESLRPERPLCRGSAHPAGAFCHSGRNPRPAHPDPGPHRYPAQHAESSLLSGAERPLRPGAGRLCPLYQPHSPLPGPCHPSHPDGYAGGQAGAGAHQGLYRFCHPRQRAVQPPGSFRRAH